jgi:hypothetical protein
MECDDGMAMLLSSLYCMREMDSLLDFNAYWNRYSVAYTVTSGVQNVDRPLSFALDLFVVGVTAYRLCLELPHPSRLLHFPSAFAVHENENQSF